MENGGPGWGGEADVIVAGVGEGCVCFGGFRDKVCSSVRGEGAREVEGDNLAQKREKQEEELR